jgi:hypothetical protein
MTEAQIALARRLVAAPGWRWLPGMRVAGTKFARVVAVRDSGPCGAEEGATCDDNAAEWLDEGATPMLPDLSDPLTAHGLLALVRERWGATAHLVRFDTNVTTADGTTTEPACWWALASRPFRQWTGGRLLYVPAPTEVEVLILALEVSP